MLVSRSLFELIREMGRPEFKDPDDRLNSIVPPPPPLLAPRSLWTALRYRYQHRRKTMTYQRDPETERDIDTRREPVGRASGARWSPIALTFVVLLVLVAGWAWLASRAGPGDPTTTTSSDRATDPNMTLKQPGN